MTHDLPIFGGHDAEIDSVMFFSNDKYLILGLDDYKVFIWNVYSGVLVVGPFYCHLRYFYTIPILINSKYIVAGTGDDAVQVQDMGLKKMVTEPF